MSALGGEEEVAVKKVPPPAHSQSYREPPNAEPREGALAATSLTFSQSYRRRPANYYCCCSCLYTLCILFAVHPGHFYVGVSH